MGIKADSSLATMYIAHPNNYGYNIDKMHYTVGRMGAKIEKITLHHMAGVNTAAGCGSTFQNPSRYGSAHYGVGYDGSIGQYVREADIAWADSNWNSNCTSISIETSNSFAGNNWPVNDVTLAALIKLVADIAKRNNLGKLVKGENFTWHQMYAATACPGPYLLSKIDYIIEQANKINYPPVVPPATPTKHTGKLDGNNINRGANQLIRYTYSTKYKTTKTNKYGYEIAVNSKGIVTNIADGIGNMTIPVNGWVFSGHGIAATYLKGLKLKVGNSVWQESGILKYSTKQYKDFTNLNALRTADTLIVFNKGKSTGTNKYGYEVAVVNGKAQAAPVYGKGNMTIPSGGFVISGHGISGQWLKDNIKKGTKITYNADKKLLVIG